MPAFAAVDLGASGGRVMVGTVQSDAPINLNAVHRFPNGVTEIGGHLRWDFDRLYAEMVSGLTRAGPVESIGIDTWGVDYGLLDEDGSLLADPIAYRDGRTADVIEQVHRIAPPEELFAINGLQFLPFNTIYQLAAERRGPLWSKAAHVVLLPDLIAHRLTGDLSSELTNASTTGLLDVTTQSWSTELLDRFDIAPFLLPPITTPGTTAGALSGGPPVVRVGSHDTASAVVAVPATTDRFAYIASGTWSLVGIELRSPVLTEAARVANFTNEIGVDGRTRFLRNVGGLWLLQECLREWGRGDLDDLLVAAAQLPAGGPLIDVDDPAWIPPGAMPERIRQATTLPRLDPATTTRCILDSLAAAYARTIAAASSLADHPIDVVHIVGGGSQNHLLCQLTADATQRPVLAGPVEATALGNVLIQARAAGCVPGSLEAIRAHVAATTPLQRYDRG